MLERKSQPLLPRPLYYRRLARSFAMASMLIAVSLAIGMAGYHGFERLSWLDAFLNAAMIMSGMGPVSTMQTPAGKLFAGCYALYCGLALITAAAILFAPIVHRFIHRFHGEDS
jgi:hypothetical protein